jgi:hypothetical protein
MPPLALLLRPPFHYLLQRVVPLIPDQPKVIGCAVAGVPAMRAEERESVGAVDLLRSITYRRVL